MDTILDTIAQQRPALPRNEVFVQPPRRIGQTWYVDIAVTSQSTYESLRTIHLSFRNRPLSLVFSGAPLSAKHAFFRINGIDTRTPLPTVLRCLRLSLPQLHITSFWAMYRNNEHTDGKVRPQDFTGIIYFLAEARGSRFDPHHTPGFIDMSNIDHGRRLPLFFEGRPADCTSCTNSRVPRHLAKDCGRNRRP